MDLPRHDVGDLTAHGLAGGRVLTIPSVHAGSDISEYRRFERLSSEGSCTLRGLIGSFSLIRIAIDCI